MGTVREVKPEEMSPEERAFHEKLLTDPGMRMFMQLGKVKDNPRLLILVAHGFIELMVNTLIDAKLKNGKMITSDARGYPHSTRLLVLNEVGILTDSMYRILTWFRKLRNRAAHEPLFEVTVNDLQLLKAEYRDPSKLYLTLINILGGFWGDHLEVFLPVFMPTLAERAKHGNPQSK